MLEIKSIIDVKISCSPESCVHEYGCCDFLIEVKVDDDEDQEWKCILFEELIEFPDDESYIFSPQRLKKCTDKFKVKEIGEGEGGLEVPIAYKQGFEQPNDKLCEIAGVSVIYDEKV